MESWVLAQGHRKPCPGTPISTPESSEAQVVTSVADVQPRRITPIPISRAQNQPSNAAVSKSPEELQQSASELIQRYEAEKAAAEALSEKYKQAHMEKLKMGYVPPGENKFDEVDVVDAKSVKPKKKQLRT